MKPCASSFVLPASDMRGGSARTVPRATSSLSPSYTPYYPRSQQPHQDPEGIPDGGSGFYNYADYFRPYAAPWTPSGFYAEDGAWSPDTTWQWGVASALEYSYANGSVGDSYCIGAQDFQEEEEEEEEEGVGGGASSCSPREALFFPPPPYGQNTASECHFGSRFHEDLENLSHGVDNHYSSPHITSTPFQSGIHVTRGRNYEATDSENMDIGRTPLVPAKSEQQVANHDLAELCLGRWMENRTTLGASHSDRPESSTAYGTFSKDESLSLGLAWTVPEQVSIVVDQQGYPESKSIISSFSQNLQQQEVVMIHAPTACQTENSNSKGTVVGRNIESGDSTNDMPMLTNDHTSSTDASSSKDVPNNTAETLCPLAQTDGCSTVQTSVAPDFSLDINSKGSCNDQAYLKEDQNVLKVENIYAQKLGHSSGLHLPVNSPINSCQMLISSIYNLTTILVTNQFTKSDDGCDFQNLDCLEQAIYMLSQYLLQKSNNFSGSYHEDTIKSEESMQKLKTQEGDLQKADACTGFQTTGLGTLGVVELQTLFKTLFEDAQPPNQKNHSKESFSKVSRGKLIEADQMQHPEVSRENLIEAHHMQHSESSVKELLKLQSELVQLQEEMAYERHESIATVAMYKRLWTEAQEGLKQSQSDIRAVKAELESLKQLLWKTKHSEFKVQNNEAPELGQVEKSVMSLNRNCQCENLSDYVTISSQNSDLQEICKKTEGFCNFDLPDGSSDKGSPIIENSLTADSYHVDTSKLECSDAFTNPFPDANNVISRFCVIQARNGCGIDKSGKDDYPIPNDGGLLSLSQATGRYNVNKEDHSLTKCDSATPVILDHVSQRLSVLLQRQELDINAVSDSSICESAEAVGLLSTVSGLVDAIPPDRTSEYADTSVSHPLPVPTSLFRSNYSQLRKEDEEEVEIIFLKPVGADNSFGCPKADTDWEHIQVKDSGKLTG